VERGKGTADDGVNGNRRSVLYAGQRRLF
jgi:hypothetical protein